MKFTQFQVFFVGLFIFLGIIGLLTFSGIIKIGKQDATVSVVGEVSLWGSTPADVMRPVIEDFNNKNKDLNISYTAIDEGSFNQALLEALAEGKGPDMFLLSDELARSYINRITAISYAQYPSSIFQGNFVGAGDIFRTPRAIIAFPLTVDPLVMYHNRSLLNSAGIIYPPTDWVGLSELASQLTKKDGDNNIQQSMVGLGQFTNVTHAKDILITLFLQAGNQIAKMNEDGMYDSMLGDNTTEKVTLAAIRYYTSFADPASANYSWHRGLAPSKDAFISEDLVFYFGYGSEINQIINRNPNLDMNLTEIPQSKNSKVKITKARVTGVAISAFSKKQDVALAVANLMTESDFIRDFAKATGTAPARRDLLASKLADPYMPTIFKSALYAKSWPDPDPKETNNLFRVLIDNIISNTSSVESALRRADGQLNTLLKR